MFKKAERKQVKLKVAVTGPTGSGKTWSALRLATGLGGKIAFIDTENKSASLYAEFFNFDVLDLSPPFTTEKYIEAINFAEKSGYDSIVIDSLTHAWAGEGGLLEQKTLLDARPGSNQWTNWGPIDKKDNALKNAFLHSSCHIIATMRSKMEYTQTQSGDKKKIEKLGLAPIQRDGLSYEFSVVFDVAMDHNAEVSKDRTHLFDNTPVFKITEETGKMIAAWLASGKAVEPEPKSDPTKPVNTQGAASLAEYKIANGKLKDKALRDLSLDALQGYLTESEAYFEKQGKAPWGSFKDDMNNVWHYLQDQNPQSSLSN